MHDGAVRGNDDEGCAWRRGAKASHTKRRRRRRRAEAEAEGERGDGVPAARNKSDGVRTAARCGEERKVRAAARCKQTITQKRGGVRSGTKDTELRNMRRKSDQGED